MSVLMKKHLTKSSSKPPVILHIAYEGHMYHIPQSVAEKYQEKPKMVDKISPEEIFVDVEKQYTKAGLLLKGARHREGLTQVALALKLHVTQADLSKMENGKRLIGKAMAKRIEAVLRINYRYLL